MTDTPIQVGDELALHSSYGRTYSIYTVTRISPSGRITLGDGRLVLDPDLRVRGRGTWSNTAHSAERVTPEIRNSIRLHSARAALRAKDWRGVSDEIVLAVYALLRP